MHVFTRFMAEKTRSLSALVAGITSSGFPSVTSAGSVDFCPVNRPFIFAYKSAII